MKQRTQKYLHAILALVLSLCLITGCSLFQILHRKQTKIPLRKPLQKKQLKTLLTTPPASQTKQPWLQPGKPLTSTRKPV